MEPVTQQQETVTKQKNPLRIEQGKKLVEYKKRKKEELKRLNEQISGDLRQGSSNNSVTNFVLGVSYIFQRETQPSFEDLLLVVLVILRRRFATRF